MFDAPIEFDDTPFAHIPAAVLDATMVTNRLFYEQTRTPITRDGITSALCSSHPCQSVGSVVKLFGSGFASFGFRISDLDMDFGLAF